MAIGSKLSRDKARIYCIVGDGESQEGQVWEAIMLAAQKKLNNFTLFIDNNKMQIDDTTENVVKMEDYEKKMKAFGFNAIRIDGHDHDAIDQAENELKEELKLDFDTSGINATSIAGSLIALMGAGLFAAGLSTIANGDLSKTANAEADLTSSEPQKLCDQMVSSEVLKKTHTEWLDGKYVFKGTAFELLTYEHFKAQIGCDATVYYYDKIQNARVYTWIAQDDNSYSLCVWFKQKGESWNLYLIPPQ